MQKRITLNPAELKKKRITKQKKQKIIIIKSTCYYVKRVLFAFSVVRASDILEAPAAALTRYRSPHVFPMCVMIKRIIVILRPVYDKRLPEPLVLYTYDDYERHIREKQKKKKERKKGKKRRLTRHVFRYYVLITLSTVRIINVHARSYLCHTYTTRMLSRNTGHGAKHTMM